jgi:c-di-GMP-binding flagellar brake protein YcgR
MTTSRRECHNLDDVLLINRPVQVSLTSDENKYIYKSSIADFDSGHILITPITRHGRPASLRNGEKIQIVYFGVDAMYEFSTVVTGHKKENNLTLVIVEKPRHCGRVQRREFFRYPLSQKAHFRLVDYEDVDGKRKFTAKGKAIECYFDDISGGGLAFHTSKELVDESYILFEFALDTEDKKTKTFREIIKIIRTKKINPLDRKGDFEYTYGSSFVTLTEEKQSDIIKYIIWRQIEERKIRKTARQKKNKE